MLLPEFVFLCVCVCVLLFNCGVRCYYVTNFMCYYWSYRTVLIKQKRWHYWIKTVLLNFIYRQRHHKVIHSNQWINMLLPEFVFFLCVCVLLFNCGVRCCYVGNQSCIEWFFNPLRNLLFNHICQAMFHQVAN
jgi:hypothetical protein